MFLEATRQMGKIPVHGVNPKGGELADGTPIYRSLADVPGDIDLVVSAVPAAAVLDLAEDVIARGVKVMHFFTAGFGETGDAERSSLEQQLLSRLREGGVRFIGPNCMGIHTPLGGVSWMRDAVVEPGRVGAFSQSGMNANEIVGLGRKHGIRFSNVVSFGNATDLNECDYLEFLASDEATDVILAYVEGVKDGPRFLRTARALAGRKPLAVLKGGLTEAGGRAANSHTGSLAGSAVIWEAVRRQAGFMGGESVDELLDIAVTAQRLASVEGPRVAVRGGGGGVSVLAADSCARVGIEVPWFAEQTQRALAKHTPIAGTSVRNPLDAPFLIEGEQRQAALEAIAADPNVDWLMMHTSVDSGFRRQTGKLEPKTFARELAASAAALPKPLAVVVRPPRGAQDLEASVELRDQLNAAEIATYGSIEGCARAVQRYIDWRARWSVA